MDKLKSKEIMFSYHYARLRNSKEAAIIAGYKQANAAAVGNKLLMKQSIIKAVDVFSSKDKQDELYQCVIAGLKRIAFSSSSDSVKLLFCSKDDALSQLENLDLFHVAEIKIPRENAMEIKFFDRFKALEKLAQMANDSDNQAGKSNFFNALNECVPDEEELDEV